MRLPDTPRRGDIARVSIRGQRFWVLVEARELSGPNLRVRPLPGAAAQLTQLTVTPRQVVGYWRPKAGSVV